MPCFFSSSEANHASLLGKAEVLARSKVDVSGAGLKDYYFGQYIITARIVLIRFILRACSI